jgi:hypothetical protein
MAAITVDQGIIVIKTYISNVAHTTYFWNNLHQVKLSVKKLESTIFLYVN